MKETIEPGPSITRNLRFLSLFTPEPLKVQLNPDTTVDVGQGYGFISHTFWERSTKCFLECMGTCCQNWPRPGISPIWFAFEVMPKGLDMYTVRVNDRDLTFFAETNLMSRYECQFLDKTTGKCSIYAESKPTHCDFDPQMGIYPLRKKLGLFRRLPPRNWRYPKCPIDPSRWEATDQSRAENVRILDDYAYLAQSLGLTTIEKKIRDVITILTTRVDILRAIEYRDGILNIEEDPNYL